MIKSFDHKGLEDFFYDGTTKGIQPKHASGYGLHPLKGDLKGHWAVKVSGNWRLTFRFEDGNAYVLNYQDYH